MNVRDDAHALPDALLYAVGRRAALAPVHGHHLLDLHQGMAMIWLVLGALRADERFDHLNMEISVNSELKQEVVSICTTQFGLSEQQALQCVNSYGADNQKRRKSLGYKITNLDSFM